MSGTERWGLTVCGWCCEEGSGQDGSGEAGIFHWNGSDWIGKLGFRMVRQSRKVMVR